MLKKLKSWLTRRQAQKVWEEQQRNLAYSLLGEYKAISVIISNLSNQEKENIAALMADDKYASLLRLEQNICAQWIQQCMNEEGEALKMKRGGLMLYTTTQKAIRSMFMQKMQDSAEESQMKETLNGLGW